MKAPRELTRKAGPLPVYAWALLALAAFLVYRHSAGSASAATAAGVPVAAASGAQQPASGQGSPVDNSGGDLLDALGANSDAANALLAAVQAGSGGGYGSGAGSAGFGGSSGTSTAGTSAATVTAPAVTDNTVPTDPALADPSSAAAVAVSGDQPVTGYLAPSPDAGYVIDPTTGQVYTGSTSIEGGLRQRVGQPYQADALSRYLVNDIGYDPALTATPTSPTVAQLDSVQTTVQPAPVDTTSATVAPTPTPGGRATIPQAVAV